MFFKKYEKNPILVKNEANDWESLCVLNPAVIYDDDGKFKMLYRAAGNDETHYIHLGLAESEDGFHFERMSDSPVLSPTPDNYDSGCIEDPRLIKIGEWYYLTYASRAYAPGQYWKAGWKFLGDPPEGGPRFLCENSSLTSLAISRDLRHWKKLGRITDSRFDDRDVILFPEKVNGKWVKLSRGMERCGEGYPNKNPAIWISFSDDMMEWDNYTLLMQGEQPWEDKKIGGSCPPIKTEKGWFFIYHGVANSDGAYRVGAVLLDLDDPTKVLARTKDFLMEPEFDFETQGFYNGCVFPTGNAVVDGTLYVYYGAADKNICVATCDFDELLDYLTVNCKR